LALRPSPPQSRSQQLAERGSAQQEVFLREVDDALREDTILTVARRYGKLIAALLIAGLAALAGWLWWEAHTKEQAGKAGESFILALDQVEAGRLAQAGGALQPLAAEGSPGHRASARLMQAGLAVEQGRAADAQRLFAEVAADKDAPEPYRDLATVRSVALGFDGMPPDQVVARLKPLAQPGNPWFGSAGELLASAYLKQGRKDLAGPLLATIAKDPVVPASLRSRTRQLAGLLGVDAIGDPEQGAGRAPAASAAQP
jgi:hypothetical protein